MWNDTDIPLAVLITFRSYGTWLHGDGRGSVNRFRNQYNSPRLPPEKKWLEKNTQRLKKEIVVLDAVQRSCVEGAARRDLRNSGLASARSQCANKPRSFSSLNRRQETGNGSQRIQSKRDTQNARKRLLAKRHQSLG
jgi:hypothetical protein